MPGARAMAAMCFAAPAAKSAAAGLGRARAGPGAAAAACPAPVCRGSPAATSAPAGPARGVATAARAAWRPVETTRPALRACRGSVVVRASLGILDVEQPPELRAKLAAAVAAAKLPPGARVLLLGSAALGLLPHLLAAGLSDVLVVGPDDALEPIRAKFPDPGRLGNAPGVRTWPLPGDFAAAPAGAPLPPFLGPFGGVFVAEVYGSFAVDAGLLTRIGMVLSPGSPVVLSYPMGRSFLIELETSGQWKMFCAAEPVPPPREPKLIAAAAGTPLIVESVVDVPMDYSAVLRLPPNYVWPAGPARWAAPVVSGFGRGSRQLGVPTANMDPACIPGLAEVPRGVYFGWARLASDTPEAPARKMVLNVGVRPTFAAGAGGPPGGPAGGADASGAVPAAPAPAAEPAAPEPTVEVHLMDPVGRDFYGERLRVIVTGFLRPEVRFDGLTPLLARIRTDIGLARTQLDAEPHRAAAGDAFLRTEEA